MSIICTLLLAMSVVAVISAPRPVKVRA